MRCNRGSTVFTIPGHVPMQALLHEFSARVLAERCPRSSPPTLFLRARPRKKTLARTPKRTEAIRRLRKVAIWRCPSYPRDRADRGVQIAPCRASAEPALQQPRFSGQGSTTSKPSPSPLFVRVVSESPAAAFPNNSLASDPKFSLRRRGQCPLADDQFLM